MENNLEVNSKDPKTDTAIKKCGIIMPISDHPDYSNGHWKDVLAILGEAISETEIFKPNLVSDDVASGLIHERIVTNLYTNEIVVCDVSSKNPNVMFELGLRLAFDKPTIIVKDEITEYSFDTAVIEHMTYPKALSFKEIVRFKKDLRNKLIETYQRSVSEEKYSPFLKSFSSRIAAGAIIKTEGSKEALIMQVLQELGDQISLLRVEQKDRSDVVREERDLRYVKQMRDYSIQIQALQVEGLELRKRLAEAESKAKYEGYVKDQTQF